MTAWQCLVAALLLALPAVASAQDTGGAGFACRRGIGGAVGVGGRAGSWERIGHSATYVTGSPVFTFACALDAGPVSMWAGTDLQLTYVHYDLKHDLTQGWLTATAGFQGGSTSLRFGGHVTGVPQPVGAGGELEWLPGDPYGTREGVEARVTVYWPEHPNVQAMVLFVMQTPRIF